MIREVKLEDRALYMELTGEFYASSAVMHPIPEAHRAAAFEELMARRDRAECYIAQEEGPAGYLLLMKSFSQEAGGEVIWLDELYVRESCRGRGIGRKLIAHALEKHPRAACLRLELEPGNRDARRLYERLGFVSLEYAQMILPLGG